MNSRYASVGVTACGIVLAAVPLALWVAWTPFGFLMVLAAGAVSIVLLGYLASRLPSGTDEARPPHDRVAKPVVSDEFVEEIHKISPLIYHHSPKESAKFRRAMRRLRQLMR